MSRTATIFRNIASNWAGFTVNAVITLLLTPFVLHQLGEARYGVWILTSSIIGYYGLLDLGFRGGINQYLTRYLALRDYRKASECMSTAVAVFISLGGSFSVLSLGTAYIAPQVFDFPSGMQHEVFWSILIVGLASSLQFAFFPFMSVFMATQRFELANLIGVGTRLLMVGFVYAALKMEYGLIGISAATCGASLIDYIIRWRVAYRLVPELQISYRLANRARLNEMLSFGAWAFLMSINAFIYLHAQTLLIGILMPVAAVGYYALAAGLSRQINDMLSPIGQVIYPVATELHAKGESGMLERLYHDGSRLMLLITISVILIAWYWAEDFYRLWIGEKYLTGSVFPSVVLILQILLISTVTSYSANISGQILMGVGQVRLVAMMQIGGSVLNLVFSLILIHIYGLVGVATATVIASGLVDLIVKPLVLQRSLGLSAKDFVRGAWLRPVAVGVFLVPLLWSIQHVAGRAENWLGLILQGVLAGLMVVTVILAVGITAEERCRFVVQPIRSFLRRQHLG